VSRPPSRASLWSELAGHHPATTKTTCVSPSPAHPRRSRTVPRPHAPTTLTGRSSRGGRGRGGTPRAARHPRRACRPPRSRGRRPCPPTRRRQPADRVGEPVTGRSPQVRRLVADTQVCAPVTVKITHISSMSGKRAAPAVALCGRCDACPAVGDRRLLDDCHRTGVWPDSVQVSGGGLFRRLPTECRCGSLPVCSPSGTVTRRGSKGDCPARSSTAHLAVLLVRGEAGERDGEGDHRG